MHPLQSGTRPVSQSPSSWEDGNFTESFAGNEESKDLITQANSVSLLRIFQHYRLRLDEINKKIICPFKSHKSGRENSASFYYYPETNSFYCFGCSVGGKYAHGCEFVALMEGINKQEAAYRILELFQSDVDENVIWNDANNFSERLEIMMDFARGVREFRQAHTDNKSQEFIDNICMVYDMLNLKHDLNNEALRSMVAQLKDRIGLFIT